MLATHTFRGHTIGFYWSVVRKSINVYCSICGYCSGWGVIACHMRLQYSQLDVNGMPCDVHSQQQCSRTPFLSTSDTPLYLVWCIVGFPSR